MLPNGLVLPGALHRDLFEEWVQSSLYEHPLHILPVRKPLNPRRRCALGSGNHVEQLCRLPDGHGRVKIGANDEQPTVKGVPPTVFD